MPDNQSPPGNPALARLARQQRLELMRQAEEHARQLGRAVPDKRDELEQRHEVERQELAEAHKRQRAELTARGGLPRTDKAVDEFNKAVSAREIEAARDDIHEHEDRHRREEERAKELESRFLKRDRDKGLDR